MGQLLRGSERLQAPWKPGSPSLTPGAVRHRETALQEAWDGELALRKGSGAWGLARAEQEGRLAQHKSARSGHRGQDCRAR